MYMRVYERDKELFRMEEREREREMVRKQEECLRHRDTKTLEKFLA